MKCVGSICCELPGGHRSLLSFSLLERNVFWQEDAIFPIPVVRRDNPFSSVRREHFHSWLTGRGRSALWRFVCWGYYIGNAHLLRALKMEAVGVLCVCLKTQERFCNLVDLQNEKARHLLAGQRVGGFGLGIEFWSFYCRCAGPACRSGPFFRSIWGCVIEDTSRHHVLCQDFRSSKFCIHLLFLIALIEVGWSIIYKPRILSFQGCGSLGSWPHLASADPKPP